jgi:hypothetical protein
VDLPPWLWGGDPQRLLTESELRSRSDGRNGYFVQPEESYRQQRPDLVRLRTIVKPTESLRRWKYLEHADERVVVTIPERVHQNLERRRLKAEERGALVDLVNHLVLLLHSLPLEDLREQSEYFLGTLNDIQFNEDPTRGPSATPACTSFRPISRPSAPPQTGVCIAAHRAGPSPSKRRPGVIRIGATPDQARSATPISRVRLIAVPRLTPTA